MPLKTGTDALALVLVCTPVFTPVKSTDQCQRKQTRRDSHDARSSSAQTTSDLRDKHPATQMAAHAEHLPVLSAEIHHRKVTRDEQLHVLCNTKYIKSALAAHFLHLEDGKNCHHNRSLATFLEPRMLNNLTERLQYRPLWLSRSYALTGCLQKRRNALFHMKGVVRSMQSAFLWLFRS